MDVSPTEESGTNQPGSTRPVSAIGGLTAFLLVALNLRIAVVALSPVLSDIERTEHLSDGIAGLLTTLPLACFGVFAFTTPWLARRLGTHRLLSFAMLILAAGIGLWLVPGVTVLFAGALVAGAGVGIANVVMPGMIKRHFGPRAHLVTGLYTTSLFVSGTVAAGLTVPLDTVTGIGWRYTLVLWTIPAIMAFLASASQARRSQTTPLPAAVLDEPADQGPPLRALLADPVAWAVTIFMGLQSLGYYSITAWLPTLLQNHNMPAGQASWMLSFSTFPGIAAALTTPSLNRRLGGGKAMVIIATVLCTVGYLGLLTEPVPAIYLWMTCLGLAQGAFISLAIHYIVARSPDHHHTGHLSAMAQGFGYLVACIGPVAFGAIHNLTDGWAIPILALIAVLGIQLLAGIHASRDRRVLRPIHRSLSVGFPLPAWRDPLKGEESSEGRDAEEVRSGLP